MSADQDGRGVPAPIVVTGCEDCMLENWHYGAGFCEHPEAPAYPKNQTTTPNNRGDQLHVALPSWCPLRSNPALVVLRTEVPK